MALWGVFMNRFFQWTFCLALVFPITTFGFGFDDDVPVAIQNQMTQDLSFMGGVKGTNVSSLHQEIFGAVDGKNYTDFFNKRIDAVGVNGCGDPVAVACVIPFLDPSKMWLTQNYIKFSHPQIARLMVVFHESRHTESENSNWPHATCPDPFKDTHGGEMKSIWTGAKLGGKPACDETPYGSYGSSLILLKNIQKYCSNCTDKIKMDAGIYADDQFGRIIDEGARQSITKDLY